MQPDLLEHTASLLIGSMWLIGILLAGIGGLLAYVVRQNTKTLTNFRDDIKSLFQRTEVNEKEIAYLKGAHEARTGMKLTCTAERID
jgi:hypothetical protein